MDKPNKIDEALTRGVDKIYPTKQRLEKVLLNRRIKLYQGFDPSMASLHLGNMVGLIKLKQFQDLGHQVIFLIGDFTGMIGDPTDKTTSRKKLTRQQVLDNAKNWKKQVGKILNFAGKNPAQIKFNSQWNDKISFKDLIEITSNFTVQQMMERDFFSERLKKEKPIYLHEFLYPIAQAIDCVEMAVDLEIGGSDQTFNMLAGRHLAKAVKGKEKYVLTTKLLVDNNGQKVGKTSGNALFLDIPAGKMYGAIMAFPDEVIIPGFELLTTISIHQIEQFKKDLADSRITAMNLKKRLALEIVNLIHSPKEALLAQEEFEQVFQKRKLPKKIDKLEIKEEEIRIIDLFKEIVPPVISASEVRRLIFAGAIEVDQKIITNLNETINLTKPKILRVGKNRFFEVKRKK